MVLLGGPGHTAPVVGFIRSSEEVQVDTALSREQGRPLAAGDLCGKHKVVNDDFDKHIPARDNAITWYPPRIVEDSCVQEETLVSFESEVHSCMVTHPHPPETSIVEFPWVEIAATGQTSQSLPPEWNPNRRSAATSIGDLELVVEALAILGPRHQLLAWLQVDI